MHCHKIQLIINNIFDSINYESILIFSNTTAKQTLRPPHRQRHGQRAGGGQWHKMETFLCAMEKMEKPLFSPFMPFYAMNFVSPQFPLITTLK